MSLFIIYVISYCVLHCCVCYQCLYQLFDVSYFPSRRLIESILNLYKNIDWIIICWWYNAYRNVKINKRKTLAIFLKLTIIYKYIFLRLIQMFQMEPVTRIFDVFFGPSLNKRCNGSLEIKFKQDRERHRNRYKTIFGLSKRTICNYY